MYVYIYIYVYTYTYMCVQIYVHVYSLRVEFLLKTVSGYPKDTGVSLYTLVNPENPLRCDTPRFDGTR